MSVAALALAGVLAAAPAPPHRPRPAPGLAPGRWTFSWGGAAYPATLHASGAYECEFGGARWSGWWHWEPGTRTLRLSEAREGDPRGGPMAWEARLDVALSGTARWGEGQSAGFSARPRGGPR